MLMDDNAGLQRAAIARTIFVQQNVPLLPWPAFYPDMTPMEDIRLIVLAEIVGKSRFKQII